MPAVFVEVSPNIRPSARETDNSDAHRPLFNDIVRSVSTNSLQMVVIEISVKVATRCGQTTEQVSQVHQPVGNQVLDISLFLPHAIHAEQR